MAPRINHVSINARNLQESVDFYVELLGAEPLATPNFGIPVQWLALGRTQLHLFEKDLQPTSHHHLGITVDDLEPVYRAAERHGAFDDEAFGNRLVELPGDVVQLYLRDPAGNLVEIDMAGVDRLPDDLRAQLKALWDFHPHSEEQLVGAAVRARLGRAVGGAAGARALERRARLGPREALAERRHRELGGADDGRPFPDSLQGIRFVAAEKAGQGSHSVVSGRRRRARGLDTQDTGGQDGHKGADSPHDLERPGGRAEGE